MNNAEMKVKAVYPEAKLEWGHVRENTSWSWSTDKNAYYGRDLFTIGVWVGDKCLVYGGKFEFKIWQRAWKQICREMLEKLES